MKFRKTLLYILKQQGKSKHKLPVDITLVNGNIYLKEFYILSFDPEQDTIQGLTAQEEYTYLRENREPVYCFLKLKEIKDLTYEDLISTQSRQQEIAS